MRVIAEWRSHLRNTRLTLRLRVGFDPAIREQLPQWNALLQIYSIFFVPVLMAMLFELNLAAVSIGHHGAEDANDKAEESLISTAYSTSKPGSTIPSLWRLT